MDKFIATYDLHYGFERKNRHRVPLHDQKAWNCVLQFAKDFKPHHWIMGGDILDCGAISHHNHGKPGRTEGLRLAQDAQECVDNVILPVEALTSKSLTYIIGNHEDWLEDLLDKEPMLDGLVDVATLLRLQKWKIVPQGECHKLGKLHFIHGDQISGGENAAKNAVMAYEESVRLGHFHTFQTATKTSAVENKTGKTGTVVPCLCGKNPAYNEGKPNRWMQGFLYGYVHEDGTFADSVVVIINGRCIINGKVYNG